MQKNGQELGRLSGKMSDCDGWKKAKEKNTRLDEDWKWPKRSTNCTTRQSRQNKLVAKGCRSFYVGFFVHFWANSGRFFIFQSSLTYFSTCFVQFFVYKILAKAAVFWSYETYKRSLFKFFGLFSSPLGVNWPLWFHPSRQSANMHQYYHLYTRQF